VTLERVEVSVRGRRVTVDGVRVSERIVVVSPGWLKIAEIHDDPWLEDDPGAGPEACVAALRREKLAADLFTFAQKLPDVTPKYPYYMEWDHIAVIAASDFTTWWQRRIPQETRKNVRRAGKRGVVVREVDLDDGLLRGIMEINNETPVRQGRRFWHYGKTLAEVSRDYRTLVDHSTYLGAYHGGELIGFLKLVYAGQTAAILQLLCKRSHSDKRPANALVARAVEMCHAKGVIHLAYGQYSYRNKTRSSLIEFKRRNGFEPRQCPRYYVPLTLKGRLALAAGVHRGWQRLIPEPLMERALRLRSAWYERLAPHDRMRLVVSW
jgi:hypothetical protein